MEGRKKKMRLIDADKLRINCFCVDRICVDGRTIENAPTIKAIPIEWIRKWNIDNYPYTALLMSEIIPKMIEDWEKENETN